MRKALGPVPLGHSGNPAQGSWEILLTGNSAKALQPMVAVALASSSGGTPLSWRSAIVACGAGLRSLQQRQRGGSGCAAGVPGETVQGENTSSDENDTL